ncbi:MAG: PAS domain-containing protein, partial [Acidobacteriaceae bacterium]|nr:PAS domain-containing protein [Acidobacteriaceae bacterium]
QMVWTARPDGYIDYYNERWYEFTGFSREVFGDASWVTAIHPEDMRATLEAYYTAIRSGQPYNFEHRLWDRSEERWRWFIGRALPIFDHSGRISKWFGTSTDIDPQKHVEDDLRRANEALEQFAFSASHDLQEPLRAIKIYGELLAKRHAEKLDPQALDYIRFLRDGAVRMEALVRDLLTYTEALKYDRSVEIADANAALRAALDNLSSAISESAAQVTADRLPSVPVSPTHLQQLFQNLVGNAVKYRSPERIPTVRITAERQNGDWIFAVSDNGIGIDPQYKEHIFGLFKRLHTKNEYAGTGIGLAICRRIVDQYRGRIWVDSAPGQGSTFRFSLPE